MNAAEYAPRSAGPPVAPARSLPALRSGSRRARRGLRHRVEQTPRARSERRVNAGSRHARHHRPRAPIARHDRLDRAAAHRRRHGRDTRRHPPGSRIACVPPGIGTGSKYPTRSKPVRSAIMNSPPQSVPSSPYPRPSNATPITGPSTPLSARQAATCAWWCWTAMRSTPSISSACLVDRYSGWQVVRDNRRGRCRRSGCSGRYRR